MQSSWFPRLGLAAFCLVVASFAVLGLGRLVVSAGTARTASLPFLFGGFVLALAGFVIAVLVKVGAVDVEE